MSSISNPRNCTVEKLYTPEMPVKGLFGTCVCQGVVNGTYSEYERPCTNNPSHFGMNSCFSFRSMCSQVCDGKGYKNFWTACNIEGESTVQNDEYRYQVFNPNGPGGFNGGEP
ncbi:hypothetical protein BGX27_009063, partial [Mortierella sp. AM989]